MDDILKPLLFGLISAAWMFAICLCAALWFDVDDPFIISGLVAGVVGASTWLFLAREERHYTEWRRSVSNGKKPTNGSTRVEYRDDNKNLVIANLPGDVAQLALLGRGVLGGVPFSEQHWTGSRAPFSRSQFRELRDIMLRRGWLQWRGKSKTQGLELTHAGRAVFQHFVDMPSPAEEG